MRHWALKHFKSQVAGQGPGGPGQHNEAFALNKSSNALCRGSVGLQGRSWGHPANCSTEQEAGRSQQEPEGTMFRDQGTPSEPNLMAFWAVTCRGSGSNRDLGASTGPMLLSKHFDKIKERTESSAGNVFRSQRLLVYYFCFNAREQFQFQTHHFSEQILWSYPD